MRWLTISSSSSTSFSLEIACAVRQQFQLEFQFEHWREHHCRCFRQKLASRLQSRSLQLLEARPARVRCFECAQVESVELVVHIEAAQIAVVRIALELPVEHIQQIAAEQIAVG